MGGYNILNNFLRFGGDPKLGGNPTQEEEGHGSKWFGFIVF